MREAHELFESYLTNLEKEVSAYDMDNDTYFPADQKADFETGEVVSKVCSDYRWFKRGLIWGPWKYKGKHWTEGGST